MRSPPSRLALAAALLSTITPLLGCSGDVTLAQQGDTTSGSSSASSGAGGGASSGSSTSGSSSSGSGGQCATTWVHVLGGPASQLARSVAVDDEGALLTSLKYHHGVALDGAALTGVPADGFMVTKFDAAGSLVYRRAFGGSFQDEILPIAADPANNLVLGGSFYGTIDLGEGVTATASSPSALVAKLDPQGHPLWVEGFGGAAIASLAVDGAGGIFIGGQLDGSAVDFGWGPSSGDFFLAKLDPSGAPQWAKTFTGAMLEPHPLAVTASGALVVVGTITGYTDFGGGLLTSAGGDDLFVLELDGAGNHVFSERFGDTELQRAQGVSLDGAGNIVLTGIFAGAIDFGTSTVVSPGPFSGFVAKLDPAGKPLWSKQLPPGKESSVFALAAEPSGGVWLAGVSYGPFDPGCGELAADPTQPRKFLARLDAGGSCSEVRDLGKGSVVEDMAIDASGRVALAGGFGGDFELGGSVLTSDGVDAFAAMLEAPCVP